MSGAVASAAAILEIDLAAIAANWRALGVAHGGRPVAAVLKADAYGTGAERVAPYLHAAGCRHFFVAHLDEALALRPLLPEAMIAVLNGLLPGSEAAYQAAGIDPVLCSLDEIACWQALARRCGRALPALLQIDTGINRRGLGVADVATLAADPAQLDGIALRYTMTHLASADEPGNPENTAQAARFHAARGLLPAAPCSIAASAAIMLGDTFRSDLARPGLALYGGNPMPGQPNAMCPVVRLRAQVLQVREVAPGSGVGYNVTWRAERPSRIAVVGVGYADGYPRTLSNRGYACVDGASLPLVGRVSMDLTTFDVTDQPQIQPGHWLDLIGPGCDVDQVAERAGTIPYDVLTRLGRRYARVWTG